MLEALIEPRYPKMGRQGGRRPFPLRVMLRIYCLQQWYSLSDPGAEEALYDIQSMRAFCGLSSAATPFPTRRRSSTSAICSSGTSDEGDLRCRFGTSRGQGRLLRGGTIVDATLIAASPSTKNKGAARPEMSQSKREASGIFGMKAHVGADAESGWCTRRA